MDSILGHPDTARLTLAFLTERVGMTEDVVGRLLGVSPAKVRGIVAGEDVGLDEGSRRAIRGLAATQSLLLSGYTPTGAAAWMRHPCRFLGGRSPRELMSSGDPAATALILRAANARMAA